MIIIKEAKTKKELKDFVKFPFKLYKDCPYWIPPLINDELENFEGLSAASMAALKRLFFIE